MPSSDLFENEVDEQGRQTVLVAHGYRITRSLGHGSYASVKSAFSERHQMNVAIKIITKKRAPKDYLEKFLPRELAIVKMLKHQNLIVFYQVSTVALSHLLDRIMGRYC